VLRRERAERPVRYMEALLIELGRQQYNQRRRLEARLRSYVERKERQPQYTALYELFDENLVITDPRDTSAIASDCRDLIAYFEQAAADSQRPQVSLNRRPGSDRQTAPAAATAIQDAALPASPALDAPVDVTAKSLLGSPAASLASDSARGTPVAQTGPSIERRVLTEADVLYILGETIENRKDPVFPVVYQFMRTLQADGGVLKSDGNAWMVRSAPQVPAGREATIQAILDRFEERFSQAKPIVSASALYLRVGKTD